MKFIRITDTDGQVIFLNVNVISNAVCDRDGKRVQIFTNSLKSGRSEYVLQDNEASAVIDQLEKLLP